MKNAMKRTAAAAALGFALLFPMKENIAHAQQAQTQELRAPETRSFSGAVSQNTEILSLVNSERVLDEQISPATIAEFRVSAIDERGVEFTLTLDGRASDPLRVNFDGTTSGNTRMLDILGFSGFRTERTESGETRVAFDYSIAPAPARSERRHARRERPALTPYDDPVLCPYSDQVNVHGVRRHFDLQEPFDIGGNVYSNEAGSSVYATARLALRRPNGYVPIDGRLSAGNMWFGEQAAPFASLYIRPAFQAWYFRGAYYGRISAVGNMASQLYTSHSLGLGLSVPLGEHNRLRLGAVVGGAFSYPAYDDIYLNLATGASFEHRNWLVYAMPTFYMAAPSPIQSAYYGNYQPQFQNIDFGVQVRFNEDRMAARIFGDISRLYQRFGGRLSASWVTSERGSVDVYGGLGATHFIDVLGGRWDPMVFAGISGTFDFGGFTSTNTGRYEHFQRGAFRSARTDIPTQASPGPYGFGRSGNPLIDGDVQLAKDRILSSGSYAEFVQSYNGASTNQLITTARFMGAFLQQVAYANNALEALSNVRQFDPEVRRIAGATHDDIYGFMQQYVDFYNNNPPGTPLPESLRNGIAVCAGIHSTMANFLESNGIPTLIASVNTRSGPHVVAIAMPPGETDLLDYGNLYQTPAGTPDEAMRFYGMARQAPTFQSQLWRPGQGYLGTYETSEGRLLHRTIGLDNREILGTEYLGVR